MRLISAILLNPFWRLSPALPSNFDGALRRFSISLRNLSTLGTSSLRLDNAKNEKLKFSLFGVPHPLDFSNGKVRPSCYFGKSRTSVYEWRPHNKNSKTFLPWLQAPIKILSGKNRAKRRPDFCFSNEKRGSVHYWKIITNWLGVKKKKKASEKGAKMGIFGGVFPCIYY